MNYKHTRTGEVISFACWDKLSREKKLEYNSTYEDVTHKVEERDRIDSNDDGLDVVAIAGSFLLDSVLSQPDVSEEGTSIPDNAFGGFGDGDAGGAGAGGQW